MALGSRVLDTLINAAVFDITVLARQSSESQFPPSVQVAHVDYYTLIRNGMFLDWGLVTQYHFAFNSETPFFYDGGDRPFSTTILHTVGRAGVRTT